MIRWILEKLWSCLQSVGVNDRFLRFLQALYDVCAQGESRWAH